MCEPVSIVTAAVAIVGAVYSADQQRKNARRQERLQRRASKIQEDQIQAENDRKADLTMRQARAERARLRAASAESGLAGISIEDTLNNVDMQAGTDLAYIETNRYNNIANSRLNQQSALNSIQQPDWVATGLQIAGAATGSYADYQQSQTNAGGRP